MKTKPQNYKDLVVGPRGIALAKIIYRLTRSFPTAKSLCWLRKCPVSAVSISSNIAEGKPGIPLVSLCSLFRTPKAQ
jgi:hypothetical protein